MSDTKPPSEWARLLDQARAEAWDEGAKKAQQYRADLDLSPLNPYRTGLADTEADQ